jgi:hypothetical protein
LQSLRTTPAHKTALADILRDGINFTASIVRHDELRSILLVKAIEEVDQAGTLMPPADRIAATREARRAVGDLAPPGDVIEQGTLSEAAQRMGVERSRILLGKIVARHPFVDTVLNLAVGLAWAGWVVVALGLVLGFALSALDGTRRINILAFPLLGVVLWNLAVYVAIFVNWLRARSTTKQTKRWVPEALTKFGMSFVTRQVARAGAFNVPLAEALRRFTREWFEVARPLLVARATRLFHLSAVAVGIGLIVGLYVRGIAFDYLAGWESTFLNASSVRALLSIIYGPASFITGISIPDVAYLETIRWTDGAGASRRRAGFIYSRRRWRFMWCCRASCSLWQGRFPSRDGCAARRCHPLSPHTSAPSLERWPASWAAHWSP